MTKIEKKTDFNEWKGIYIFIEIKDHEVIEPGSIELVSKSREMADKINEPLVGIMLAQHSENYIKEITPHKLDELIVFDGDEYRHYDEQIFVPLILELIKDRKPSIFLLAATEAGRDLGPRLSQDIPTGLTADCTSLEIIDHPKFGKNILGMTRPAFGGNIMATIVCPYSRPQMSTVRPGTWQSTSPDPNWNKMMITKMNKDISNLEKMIQILCLPTRFDKKTISLENADVIVAGGRGIGSKDNFSLIFKLAELLNAQVGASRAAVFENFIEEEYLIGQTGKTVHPKVYIAVGISGQIQHLTGMNTAELIIAINKDKNAPIHKIADYSIYADLNQFLPVLIKIIGENKIPISRAPGPDACA